MKTRKTMTVNGATYEARAICKLSQQVATVQARLAGPGGEWVDVTLPYVDADVRDAAVAACGRDVAYYRMRAELAARRMDRETHEERFERLTAEGHDVAIWRDDPSMLAAYARGVKEGAVR